MQLTQKRGVALATAALSVGGLFAVGAAPGAAAAPARTQSAVQSQAVQSSAVRSADVNAAARCRWPNVCFYRGNSFKAAYKDRGYQSLGPRARTANHVINSRRDDGARIYLQRLNGTGRHWECARPNRSYTIKSGWRPYAINIRNSPSCR
ncbi:hypothetical protein ACH4SP_23365 [Streptomyces sp. NPDC021093]|uniref:hypothetical protein n=1 Tax=Streptomyces sp. NPDC021093 TaxID=3365112 RepID=UPI0037A21211